MTSRIQKAQHNEKFLSDLMNSFPDNYFDWKITVVFYYFVQAIEAYAESKGIELNASSHVERENKINPIKENVLKLHPRIYEHYRYIYELSIKTRYKDPDDDLEQEYYKLELTRFNVGCIDRMKDLKAQFKKRNCDLDI